MCLGGSGKLVGTSFGRRLDRADLRILKPTIGDVHVLHFDDQVERPDPRSMRRAAADFSQAVGPSDDRSKVLERQRANATDSVHLAHGVDVRLPSMRSCVAVSGVDAGVGMHDAATARVQLGKLGHVVNHVVEDQPVAGLGVVALCDLRRGNPARFVGDRPGVGVKLEDQPIFTGQSSQQVRCCRVANRALALLDGTLKRAAQGVDTVDAKPLLPHT